MESFVYQRLIVSPLVAGLAVGIGVPILLFYVYGVVPVSLCRAGGCGGGAGARGGEGDAHSMPPSVDEVPERRQEPSIGDASLSAGSVSVAEARGSLGALAGSLAGDPAQDDPALSVHRSALLKSLFLYGSAVPPDDLEAGPCSCPPPQFTTQVTTQFTTQVTAEMEAPRSPSGRSEPCACPS
ncbi:unnamed protein product [Plutella xylostella]|uniref:(diamondback moth) hypothetical protein n=1 Tax=Plutella xylostella TaxID=51655 RepID=A0A8S4G392_PLUXY|nr:unnamed protein product [Plutella xylostella]